MKIRLIPLILVFATGTAACDSAGIDSSAFDETLIPLQTGVTLQFALGEETPPDAANYSVEITSVVIDNGGVQRRLGYIWRDAGAGGGLVEGEEQLIELDRNTYFAPAGVGRTRDRDLTFWLSRDTVSELERHADAYLTVLSTGEGIRRPLFLDRAVPYEGARIDGRKVSIPALEMHTDNFDVLLVQDDPGNPLVLVFRQSPAPGVGAAVEWELRAATLPAAP